MQVPVWSCSPSRPCTTPSHVSYAQWPCVQYLTTCHLRCIRRRHPLFLRSHWTCPHYRLHPPLRNPIPSSSTSTGTPKELSRPLITTPSSAKTRPIRSAFPN